MSDPSNGEGYRTDFPVIFSAPMVRALLDGRKTMTRRQAWQSAKVVDGHTGGIGLEAKGWREGYDNQWFKPSPWQKVRPGDRLWVRETHYVESAGYKDGTGRRILYRATDPDAPTTWTPSIHMPRWASRLTLVVIETKLERLQAISEADAKAEGAVFHSGGGIGHSGYRHNPDDGYVFGAARDSFARLWRLLHGPDSWAANPEVVALRFAVYRCNIDAMGQAA